MLSRVEGQRSSLEVGRGGREVDSGVSRERRKRDGGRGGEGLCRQGKRARRAGSERQGKLALSKLVGCDGGE